MTCGNGADDLFVSGEVVGVAVGDKGEGAGAVRVESQTQLGKGEGTRMEVERHVESQIGFFAELGLESERGTLDGLGLKSKLCSPEQIAG